MLFLGVKMERILTKTFFLNYSKFFQFLVMNLCLSPQKCLHSDSDSCILSCNIVNNLFDRQFPVPVSKLLIPLFSKYGTVCAGTCWPGVQRDYCLWCPTPMTCTITLSTSWVASSRIRFEFLLTTFINSFREHIFTSVQKCKAC
jgi:hypothetical protein